MKKVKSLILSVVLVCSLNAGVRAGDIGTPGYVPPDPPSTSDSTGDIGTPGCESTEADVQYQEVTENSYYNSNEYMLYIFWTALLLF